MMIVHEVMGRDCGWLTAATAAKYRERLEERSLLPMIGVTKTRLDVHAVYVPEMSIDLEKEAARLRAILDENDNVNIFISEGAGVKVRSTRPHTTTSTTLLLAAADGLLFSLSLFCTGHCRAHGGAGPGGPARRLRPRQARLDQPGQVLC